VLCSKPKTKSDPPCNVVANDPPDFRTISDFRKIHLAAFRPLFLEVLRVAGEMGMVAEGCQTLFLVSHSAGKNQKQSLTPRSAGSLGTAEMPRLCPRVKESGRCQLTQELKQVPAHWESKWAPNYRHFS